MSMGLIFMKMEKYLICIKIFLMMTKIERGDKSPVFAHSYAGAMFIDRALTAQR